MDRERVEKITQTAEPMHFRDQLHFPIRNNETFSLLEEYDASTELAVSGFLYYYMLED